MELCRRKTDGALFRPSYPDDYCGFSAFSDCFNGRAGFYFRRVRLQPRRWWQFRAKWADTGEVWQPKANEFDVVAA